MSNPGRAVGWSVRVLLLLGALLGSAPGFAMAEYAELTPDQLEHYARAREAHLDQAEALEFAVQPHPRRVEELSQTQLDDYRGMREAGFPHQEAFDYATAPVGPSGAADLAGSELGDADSVRAEQEDAAAARRRANWLRGDVAGVEWCAPDVLGGGIEPRESPWTLHWPEPGLGWAAETATLLNTAASAGGGPVAGAAAGRADMSAEEAARYLAAFGASEALRLRGHAIAEARRLFAAARETALQQLEAAEAAGQDVFAEDIERFLANLELLETDWLALQHRLEAGLRRELDAQLAANAEAGLGPGSGDALVRALVEHGVRATGPEHHLIEVRARVGALIRGAAGARTDEFGVTDFLGEVESSVDRAIPTPIEVVTDPVGTLSDYGDFLWRYGHFWYGVGRATMDAIVDAVVLTRETLDLYLEVQQHSFNLWFGTEIDWVGDENLQFAGALIENLSAEQIAELTDQISRYVTRRIEQNAALGAQGELNMLEDVGYIVGTIAGAEEAAVRGVIITTRYGRVLVRGRQVSEALDGAADSARSAARLSDAAPSPASASPDPFSPSAAQPPASSAIPGTNDPRPGSLPGAPPGGIPPTRDPRLGAPPPQVAGPGLLGDTGVPMGLRRLNNPPDGAPARAHAFEVELDGYRVRLGSGNFIGGGSSSWAYLSPSDPNVVIKLTFARAGSFAGVHLDNYGYRLLEAAAIDPTRLHVPRVLRQHYTDTGQVVTVVERGPVTVRDLRRANGQLTRGMVDAIAAGTEELARNRIIWPDGKLDNMGLIHAGNDRWIMSALDLGSMMVVDSADVARRFYRDIYAPPLELLQAFDALPRSSFANTLYEVADVMQATPQELSAARQLMNSVLANRPGFYQYPTVPEGRVGEIVTRTFNITRTDLHRAYLADAYDAHAHFDHLQQGTGLGIDTLASGPGGNVYNPAAGRMSPRLREAYGAQRDGVAGDGFDSQAPSVDFDPLEHNGAGSSPMGFLPGWSDSSSAAGSLSGVSDSMGAMGPPFVLHTTAGDLDGLFDDIALGPYAGRRIVVGLGRAGTYPCSAPAMVELLLTDEELAALDDAFRSHPDVALVEPGAVRYEQNVAADGGFDLTGLQWQLEAIRMPPAERTAAAADDRAPVVAVIDTGLAWGHQDLNPAGLWINAGEVPDNGADDDGNGYVDDVVGWNFVDANNLPWDSDGHGTVVAGIIAATPGNGFGIDGVAGSARLMPLRALDHHGEGTAFDVAEAIVYAVRNGADVINLSLGGRELTRAETLAVEFADAMGAVVIAAAGNEGIELLDYGPAAARYVLSVGALGRDGERLGSSNWGGRLDLAAPGEDVISLRSPATDLMVKFDPDAAGDHLAGVDRAYYRATGTSFAAPMVAGAAALVMARHPELAPHQVRRVLLASARDLGTPGRDARTGEGMLDVAAALVRDPGAWAEAAIDGITVVRTAEGPGLRVRGSAQAGTLVGAELFLGRGEAPERWTRVARLDSEVLSGELAVVAASAFAGAPRWTLRLVVSGAGGAHREARFLVNLE